MFALWLHSRILNQWHTNILITKEQSNLLERFTLSFREVEITECDVEEVCADVNNEVLPTQIGETDWSDLSNDNVVGLKSAHPGGKYIPNW
jgi:hypothetical protein